MIVLRNSTLGLESFDSSELLSCFYEGETALYFKPAFLGCLRLFSQREAGPADRRTLNKQLLSQKDANQTVVKRHHYMAPTWKPCNII